MSYMSTKLAKIEQLKRALTKDDAATFATIHKGGFGGISGQNLN